jgi:hypothetical protein
MRNFNLTCKTCEFSASKIVNYFKNIVINNDVILLVYFIINC